MRNTTNLIILGLLLAAGLAGCASPSSDDGADVQHDAATDASADQDASTSTDDGAASDAADSTVTDDAETSGSTANAATTGTYSAGGKRVTLNQAGSSTVYPIAEAWAEEFGREIGANVVVGGGGSGAGIAKFCRGELDIADASRAMRASEQAQCKAKGIDPFEIQVAIDGLSVVVPASNDFVDCLTVAQLNQIWTSSSAKQANLWSDVDDSFPAEAIDLYGPGTDSGTYDYWKEVIIHPFDGTAATTRSDYTPSEDDNVLVRGVAGSEFGLGFFGLAYAKENADTLKILEVDGGDGCQAPTDENVAAGIYAPLSRPLYMYTDGKPEGVLAAYFAHGLGPDGQALASEVGYIGLPDDVLADMQAKLA